MVDIFYSIIQQLSECSTASVLRVEKVKESHKTVFFVVLACKTAAFASIALLLYYL